MVLLVSTDQLIQHTDAGDFEIIKELTCFRDETAQRHQFTIYQQLFELDLLGHESLKNTESFMPITN